jgi:Fic-DOC domain mobile mystery protein B
MAKYFEFPEGATPLSDCSGLIPTWIHTLSDLNRVEAENILNAQLKFLTGTVDHPQKWFQAKELIKIHKTMFDKVWDWAGLYRKSKTSIGIAPSLIPSQLAEFCHEVISWFLHPVELTFLEMSAKIHHKLVFIHPFENGNGRFSRLVADRFLLALKCSQPMWPNNLNQQGMVRKDYIQTLKSADQGDYEPLIDFIKKLGANEPKISELLKNKFYQSWIKGNRGVFLVRALLRRGSNPNDETANGHRSLQLAVKADLEEIVKLLVDAGAEVDAKDKSWLTPFQVAVIQDNKKMADFLLSKGAVLQAPPGLGYTKIYKMYQK